MIIPKKNRIAIYTFLFTNGVVCAKKDVAKEQHDLIAVPNLHVMKLMLSLKSKGWVRETYSWRWSYYFLTDEGVQAIREYLGIPESVSPNTHKVLETRYAEGLQRGPREGAPRGVGRGGGAKFGGADKPAGVGRGQ